MIVFKTIILLTIVNDDPSLRIVNDEPSLTIVKDNPLLAIVNYDTFLTKRGKRPEGHLY